MRAEYKTRIIIFTVILTGCLTGCSVSGEQPETDEITAYSSAEPIDELNIPENLLAFYLVLNSKKTFISANEGCQEFYWNEYYWRDGDLAETFTIHDFMLVDMDDDKDKVHGRYHGLCFCSLLFRGSYHFAQSPKM